MKSITTMATAIACALALTACGGGGGDVSSSAVSQQANEGIWSDLNDVAALELNYGMQAVILSDGSYWGLYGWIQGGKLYSVNAILHGASNVNEKNVSGAYTYIQDGASNGTYAGTVSAQNDLQLTFNDGSVITGESFNLSYDSIYNQPASLSAVTGSYSAIGYGGDNNGPPGSTPDFPNNLTISGSNLTVYQDGSAVMTGTIAPHGTGVNVFDVSLTATTTGVIGYYPGSVSAGTVFNGILFQPSSGILANDIEIIAAAGNNNGFFYLGQK